MAEQKLSRTARRRLDGMLENLESGSLGINRIERETLEDLVKRASISTVADGFSSSSRLGDGGRSHSEWTPVEATALAREKPIKDEVNKRVKHIESLIMFISVAAGEIHSNITEIYRQEEEKAQRPTSTPCLICAAHAVKSGYCQTHYDNWRDYGSPDRLRWELYKNETRSVDGLLMVAECPPPSPGRVARRGPYKEGAHQNLTVGE